MIGGWQDRDDAAAHSMMIAFAQYDNFMIYESYYDSKWFIATCAVWRQKQRFIVCYWEMRLKNYTVDI